MKSITPMISSLELPQLRVANAPDAFALTPSMQHLS
jgi:hypothetical protein